MPVGLDIDSFITSCASTSLSLSLFLSLSSREASFLLFYFSFSRVNKIKQGKAPNCRQAAHVQ